MIAIGDDEVLESPRKRRRKIVSGNAYERAIFQSQMAVSSKYLKANSLINFGPPPMLFGFKILFPSSSR